MDDNSEVKKSKGTKKCEKKLKTMFENYTDCLFNNKIILKSQQRFKSDHHNVYTEEINKIALSSNDDKRLQTFDRVTTYPYGTNVFKVCESEILAIKDNAGDQGQVKCWQFKIKDKLKQKNMIMMSKIPHLSQNKKKHLMNL